MTRKARRTSWRRPKLPRSRKALAAGFLCLLVTLLLMDLATLPPGDEFRSKNPDITALMQARLDEAAAQGRVLALRKHWVPLTQISPGLIRAVLVSEDAGFYSHHGFALGELWEASREALTTFSFPRGASTITQQLAKNLYLSESKNPLRKLREAVLTVKLEHGLRKGRILELYLNVIEMGDGIFGVEAASRHYFGASAEALSAEQAAFLAAIIPNPRSAYNPALHPHRVEVKKKLLLRRLHALD